MCPCNEISSSTRKISAYAKACGSVVTTSIFSRIERVENKRGIYQK